MDYYLRAIDYGLMHLEYGEEVLGELKYTGWGNHTAQIEYPKHTYSFAKYNLFGTRRTILKNGELFGKIKMERGVLIELPNDHNIKIKPDIFWMKKYEVYVNGIHHLTLHKENHWVKASFRIEIIDAQINILPIEELLGMVCYCAKFYNEFG